MTLGKRRRGGLLATAAAGAVPPASTSRSEPDVHQDVAGPDVRQETRQAVTPARVLGPDRERGDLGSARSYPFSAGAIAWVRWAWTERATTRVRTYA